ncbi:hypothetical protein JB92DRAFT_3125613 [Gautieria morchelliformis]|nr:hypothetical protein JB92DRAFT_3125613 [Gautieria morchelliformis]
MPHPLQPTPTCPFQPTTALHVSMQPIPPAVFYNTPSTPIASQAGGIEERLSPALFSNSTNAPHPPAVALSLVTSVAAPPSTPDESSNTGLDASGVLGSQPISSRKAREAFSLHDLDQLLCAVIEVNPYMAPQAKLGEHWKEVARHVQESGSCLNREPDTLKNKVASLLTWVEGGKKKTPRSALGKEWERDPALFASLSGKLDAVQHLKLEAKGTREEQKEREKQVQNAAKDAGETMRDTMVICRRPRQKRGRSPSPSVGISEKENDGSQLASISGTDTRESFGRKGSCVGGRRRTETTRLVELLEEARAETRKMREENRKLREAEREEERKARQALLEETRRANDQQERTSTALLDILRQGLLN